MAHVFNGREFAKQIEDQVASEAKKLEQHGKQLSIKCFVFLEDEGSVLYTHLKKNAAARVGIVYDALECSFTQSIDELRGLIAEAGVDDIVTGIIVQKPAKHVWAEETGQQDFDSWWNSLTDAIDPKKDVDCLTQVNLLKIENGEKTKLLPATVAAILSILDYAKMSLDISDEIWKAERIAVIGRSDIVGKPLAAMLSRSHPNVDLFGKKDMPPDLTGYDVLISATGMPGLINKVKDESIVIDVGAPKGDVDFSLAVEQAAFISPVPGGVGPVTVASLLKNAVQLAQK